MPYQPRQVVRGHLPEIDAVMAAILVNAAQVFFRATHVSATMGGASGLSFATIALRTLADDLTTLDRDAARAYLQALADHAGAADDDGRRRAEQARRDAFDRLTKLADLATAKGGRA